MVSYLVMKNNLKRLLAKKSTYILMVIIPFVLILIGSVSVKIEKKGLRIGVLGSDEYLESIECNFENIDYIQCEKADKRTINTDQIMGKYHYILKENADNKVFKEIKSFLTEKNNADIAGLSAQQRMISMLLTIYMTITTLYGMKYIQDKREGAVERVIVSGGTICSYLTGGFLSTSVITGIQLIAILSIWRVFDRDINLSVIEIISVFIFILIVSNIYGVIVTIISKSEMMAGILGSSVAVIFSILGGTFIAVENMPKVLQAVSILSPVRWMLAII